MLFLKFRKLSSVVLLTAVAGLSNGCSPVQSDRFQSALEKNGSKSDLGSESLPVEVSELPPKSPEPVAVPTPIPVVHPTPTTVAAPTPVNQPVEPQSPAPINCANDSFKGLIPISPALGRGPTARLPVVEVRNFVPLKFSYPVSSAVQRDLDKMNGDLGYFLALAADSKGWFPFKIRSGQVISYKFTTSEYIAPVYYEFQLYDRVDSAVGTILMSISEGCPGRFLSEDVMEQATGLDYYNQNNFVGDGKTRNCVTLGKPTGGSISFGVGVNSNHCVLKPNKTYYLNITAGFTTTNQRNERPGYPFIGSIDGGGDGGEAEQNVDVVLRPGGLIEAAAAQGVSEPMVPMIKNRDAYYEEAEALYERQQSELRAYTNQCRANILAAIQNGRPRTGRECGGMRPFTQSLCFVGSPGCN